MTARLEFTGAFEMLDFVQLVSDHIARSIGLDDDAMHWVGVSVRESVVNAIKHGNRHDAAKHVYVEFDTGNDDALTIRVRDEGTGFDPATLPDPLAPDNLLKPEGRGIFLIRSFMDEVAIGKAPQGGTEILMVKRR